MQTDDVQGVSTLGTAGRTCHHSDRKEDSLKRLLSPSLWLADNWNNRIAQDSHAARRKREELWCQPEGILSLGKRFTSCRTSLPETGAKAVQDTAWPGRFVMQTPHLPIEPDPHFRQGCHWTPVPFLCSHTDHVSFSAFHRCLWLNCWAQMGSWPRPAGGCRGQTLTGVT